MAIIDIILRENFMAWNRLTFEYEQETKNLRVPSENTAETLLDFNVRLDELNTRAVYDFGRIRKLKDIMDSLLESVLKDLYAGPNDAARKAGGIQHARAFPVTGYPFEAVNLYELQDNILSNYYSMQSTVRALEGKMGAKITNNALLKNELASAM
ncbi:hypothetical protein TCA2_4443 [Paenibacillus sp. TCA20]|uniref:Uncharacterized protein n=1 Tax=Paenibacillus urinalis TaxID=521520 RepID=A0ABY7XNK2_9BACL|nr:MULTISPECIES: hypothetical protein [Paenibacillus]WDI05220.1 hypothetical protein PUW25_25770 [Paenibacillus urinalis]GAK41951.1 hypothetical protein TCA2_4443 [Paenibacillus sp. TCA20]